MTMPRVMQAVVTLSVVLVALFLALGGRVPDLRSAHARPRIVDIPGPVAVTPAGKLFHDPRCPLIHGPRVVVDSAEAAREGYTPCTRCLQRAFGANDSVRGDRIAPMF